MSVPKTIPKTTTATPPRHTPAGTQYRSGIYYHDEEQKAAAMKRVAQVNEVLARGEQVRPDRPYSGKKVGGLWFATMVIRV